MGSPKKNLNIIYFIDAHKTRGIKISLKKFILLSIVFCVLMLWSFISPFLLVLIDQENTVYQEDLKKSLTVIFEYQSRYDQLFERAYPQKQRQAVILTEEISVPPIQEAALPKEELSQALENQNKALSEEGNSPPSEDEEGEDLSPQNHPFIIVEDPLVRLKNKGKLYELTFGLRNLKSPERSEGYFWAVALFSRKEGKEIFVSSPSGIKINEEGEALEPIADASHYNIRYYTSKTLSFLRPSDANESLQLEKVQIYLMDRKDPTKVHRIPVDFIQKEDFLGKKNHSQKKTISHGDLLKKK